MIRLRLLISIHLMLSVGAFRLSKGAVPPRAVQPSIRRTLSKELHDQTMEDCWAHALATIVRALADQAGRPTWKHYQFRSFFHNETGCPEESPSFDSQKGFLPTVFRLLNMP